MWCGADKPLRGVVILMRASSNKQTRWVDKRSGMNPCHTATNKYHECPVLVRIHGGYISMCNWRPDIIWNTPHRLLVRRWHLFEPQGMHFAVRQSRPQPTPRAVSTSAHQRTMPGLGGFARALQPLQMWLVLLACVAPRLCASSLPMQVVLPSPPASSVSRHNPFGGWQITAGQ